MEYGTTGMANRLVGRASSSVARPARPASLSKAPPDLAHHQKIAHLPDGRQRLLHGRRPHFFLQHRFDIGGDVPSLQGTDVVHAGGVHPIRETQDSIGAGAAGALGL
jgi:hypothetical protein